MSPDQLAIVYIAIVVFVGGIIVMATTVKDITDAITNVGTQLGGLKASADAIVQEIAALKAQIASGTPATQADLDNILGLVQGLGNQAAAIQQEETGL